MTVWITRTVMIAMMVWMTRMVIMSRTTTIAMTSFLLKNKLRKSYTFGNADIWFASGQVIRLEITKQMEFFGVKEFMARALTAYAKALSYMWHLSGAQSQRSRMSSSRFPPTIRITLMPSLLTWATRAHQYQQLSYQDNLPSRLLVL